MAIHNEELQALQGVLIEGFNPELVLEQERDHQIDKNWRDIFNALQNNLVLSATVTGFERIGGHLCVVCQYGTIRVIIPEEHAAVSGKNKAHEIRELSGRSIHFKVLNFDREAGTVTGSRSEAKKQIATITLKNIKENDVIYSVVQTVGPKGVVVDIGGIETFIPVAEIRYGWIHDIYSEVKVGDHMKVKVLSIDKENEQVRVSAKQTKENPWKNKALLYQVGSEYVGTVSGFTEYGIFVNLADGIDSLATHLKFEEVREGERVLVRVLKVEPTKERINTKIIRKIQ